MKKILTDYLIAKGLEFKHIKDICNLGIKKTNPIQKEQIVSQ